MVKKPKGIDKNTGKKRSGDRAMPANGNQVSLGEQDVFQTVSRQANEAIFLLQGEGPDFGRILAANQAAADMHGLSPDEILQMNIGQLDTPKNIKGAVDSITHFLQSEKVSFQLNHTGNDGSVFPLEVSPGLVRFKEGNYILAFDKEIARRERAQQKLKKNYHSQQVINRLLRLFMEENSLDVMLQLALDLITTITWITPEAKGAIFLVKKPGDWLELKAHRLFPPSLLEQCGNIPFGKCLCGWAAKSKKIVFANHLPKARKTAGRGMDSSGFNCNQFPSMKPHGHYCIPLLTKQQELLGVLTLYTRENHKSDRAEKEYLTAVADALSGAIVQKNNENELRSTTDSLRKALGGTVQAMAIAVEVKDPYTAGHQKRVADLARAIATEMKLPKDTVEVIRIAGRLHDLGKLSVPSEILSKSGPLSALETEFVKTHSLAGHEMLKDVGFPRPVAQAVLQHHERLDGSGYPNGLVGNKIILEARILGVADVIEAMGSHRPYRASLGLGEALREIEENKGKLYDPEVVDACLKLFNEKGFKYREP